MYDVQLMNCSSACPCNYSENVEFVYKDHPRDQQNVIKHRWSEYTGSIAWKLYTWELVKCGLYKHVVFVYRWSLEQV